MLQFWIPRCSFELSGNIFLCSSSFSYIFFSFSVPNAIAALLWAALFFLSRTITLARVFACSCSTLIGSAYSPASLLICMNEASAISLATFSFSATSISFFDDPFDDLEDLDFRLTLSFFSMIFLIYPASLRRSADYVLCTWRRKLSVNIFKP